MRLFFPLIILWSLNWPASQLALEGIPPLTFRVVTLFGGGFFLLLLCLNSRSKISVVRKDWPLLILLSLLNVGIFNILSAFALGILEGGRAAIIAFTMPVWVAIIQTTLGVRLSRRRMLSLFFGGLGMGLIIVSVCLDPLFDGFAATLMACAAFVWALGSVALSHTHWNIEPQVLAMWMTVISGIFTVLILPIQEEPMMSYPKTVGSLFGVVYATLIGMAACQAIWFAILKTTEPTRAALLLLSIPPTGTFFSWLILNSKISRLDVIALILLIASSLTSIRKSKGA